MASLTNRYTAALFEVARTEGSSDRVAADLQVLGIALEDRSFRLFLENPSVATGAKKSVLGSVLEIGDREPHVRTLKFLDVVLERGRQGSLADIVRAFRARALDARGEVEGQLETALPIEPEDLSVLQTALSKVVGKRVVLEAKIAGSLLGGFRVRVADRMFDASLKGQIDALGRKLKGIPIERLRAVER